MKYLAIDIGNVICKVDFTKFYARISKDFNLSEFEIERFLYRAQKPHDLGILNIKGELAQSFNIKSEALLEDYMKLWDETISPNIIVMDFLNRLISDDCKIALLSNMGSEHAKVIPRLFSYYDLYIKFLSCEVGAQKPTLLYYKTFLDMHPEFKGCLYVDDRQENLDMGKQFGFQGFHFDLDQLKTTPNIAKKLNEIKDLLNK
jgi:FMN phosphatase YigB (HAD superfamily)